jgi:outer membrane protein TolC
VLKNQLSRNGLSSPSIAEAHIIVTDPIRIPTVEKTEPIQDMWARALDSRPELAQDRIVIANAKINLVGTKNALLPSISVFSDLRNNALAGNINTTVNPFTGLVPNHAADSFFIGGYGTVLGQLFARNFPNYSIGASLNIPLRNRAAQANMETALLTLRQNELTVQKEINQIRVDVQNALIAVQQARVRHQAAVKARILQEQTLDAEQKKYAMGTSTPYLVISAQRDLATAQETEVQAEAAYIQARVQLDLAMGTTLESYNVEFADAKRGQVARPPSPLPVLEKK